MAVSVITVSFEAAARSLRRLDGRTGRAGMRAGRFGHDGAVRRRRASPGSDEARDRYLRAASATRPEQRRRDTHKDRGSKDDDQDPHPFAAAAVVDRVVM